jgi:cephalosporin hydroxylase
MNQSNPATPDSMAQMAKDAQCQELARRLFDRTCEFKYSYNFQWLGRPIIQYPADIMALQEVIWRVRPERIVETGIAHGGSLIFSASMLHLLNGSGRVIGVDVDIRPHNRAAIEEHPLAHRITMIQGSSVDAAVAAQVASQCKEAGPVLVVLDSSHTHEHVLRELELYSPLVTKGSYLIVLDTVIEDMPPDSFPDRPWGPGNNPKTAVREFLKGNRRFVRDEEIENKLVLTVGPEGYLKCIAD